MGSAAHELRSQRINVGVSLLGVLLVLLSMPLLFVLGVLTGVVLLSGGIVMGLGISAGRPWFIRCLATVSTVAAAVGMFALFVSALR
jgi:hypothetical protein